MNSPMQLVMLLGVAESEPTLRALFHNEGVAIYSEVPIQGHRKPSALPDPANWFGAGNGEVYSTLAFAFVEENTAHAVLKAVALYNANHPTAYPLHAYRLPVAASV